MKDLRKSLIMLTQALTDSVLAFEQSARRSRNYLVYAEYEHDVHTRRLIVARMGDLVRQLGGRPPTGGTLTGSIKRTIGRLINSDLVVGRLFEHEERHLIAMATALRAANVPDRVRGELNAVLRQLNEDLFTMEMVDFRLETNLPQHR